MVSTISIPITVDHKIILIEPWLEQISKSYKADENDLIRKAAYLAQLAGQDRATPNGESCLYQGLSMATMLSQLGLAEDILAAAIIYSSVQYADLSLEDIAEHLTPNIAKLLKGVRQMAAIRTLHSTHYDHANIDNLRKMLLALVDDARIVLIKLAECWCILRNMQLFTASQSKQIAEETLYLYAPLANRLGLHQLKWQLEDLAFRYLQPTTYKAISLSLKERRVDREAYVQLVVAELEQLLLDNVINPQVSGRAKHIYSIYRKMQRKKVTLQQIYDIHAVRVLVPTIADCYAVLSCVHNQWQPIVEEFDDYIATPKPNGYSSIHTAVIGPQQKHVEIQIRTYDMHKSAELGIAAHWLYKEGRQQRSSYEEKIDWLRQLMAWQKEVTKDNTKSDELQSQLFDDRIYVFTPNGDVLDLPQGATPLDFAYHIHTDLGHRCRGAKVNDVMVPLTYALKTGEKVAILATKHSKPSRDWLNPQLGYLQTARARSKVSHWFKAQHFAKNVEAGRALVDKELRKLHLKNFDYRQIAAEFKLKSDEDLFAALGCGDIHPQSVAHSIQMLVASTSPTDTPPTVTTTFIRPPPSSPIEIDVEGIGNLLTHIARCCKPVPGDTIIGYITQGQGVSIHRYDCNNARKVQATHPERLLNVTWGNNPQQQYAVDVFIKAYDRQGLVRDISNVFAEEKITILGLNCNVNRKECIAYIGVTIEINSLAPLERILTKIGQLPNIFEVRRQN